MSFPVLCRPLMNEVIWSQTAIAQLRAVRAYVEQFNPAAAKRLAARRVAAGNSLRNFLHRGCAVSGTGMPELATVPPLYWAPKGMTLREG
jgi:toxin ParE1/3/4